MCVQKTNDGEQQFVLQIERMRELLSDLRANRKNPNKICLQLRGRRRGAQQQLKKGGTERTGTLV